MRIYSSSIADMKMFVYKQRQQCVVFPSQGIAVCLNAGLSGKGEDRSQICICL